MLQPLTFEAKEESEVVFEKESERLSYFYKKHGFVNYSERTWFYYEFKKGVDEFGTFKKRLEAFQGEDRYLARDLYGKARGGIYRVIE